jgi:hypothetical protein
MMAAGHARGVGRRREKMVEGELQQTNSNFNSISGRVAKNLMENVNLSLPQHKILLRGVFTGVPLCF